MKDIPFDADNEPNKYTFINIQTTIIKLFWDFANSALFNPFMHSKRKDVLD